MTRLARIGASLALLAFVVGGLVGPAVHRAAHGLAHDALLEHVAAQDEHVHVEGMAVFTIPLDGIGGEHAHCALCLPTKHLRTAPLPAPSLFANDRSFAPQRPVAPSTVALALLPIRGPPAVA
jgi:hypothetical protein